MTNLLENLTCYIEKIYHFRCVCCDKWWSISDGQLKLGDSVFCSHCGQLHLINNFEIGEEKLKDIGVDQSILDNEPVQLDLFNNL